MLTQLPNLQSLDFMSQFLTGTLPPDVAFPSLQVLQLAENYISVRRQSFLLDSTPARPQTPCCCLARRPSLRHMHAGGYVRSFAGAAAESCARATACLGVPATAPSVWPTHAFARRQGTLPEAWGTGAAFPALRLLGLTKNWRVVGTLPSSWGGNGTSMQRLEVRQACAWSRLLDRSLAAAACSSSRWHRRPLTCVTWR